MTDVAPPIFIIGDTDVIMFASVRQAERDLEPIDVRSGGFVAYDSLGRLLRLEASRWRVTITLAESEPSHVSELENALRAYLKALNDPVGEDAKCELPFLVDACRKFM